MWIFLGATTALGACGGFNESGGGGDGGAGGSAGGATGGTGGQIVNAPPPPPVAISEIMYHPVDETTAEDRHEFVELYNRGDAAVSLAGFRLNGVGFTFPSGASLAGKSYLVLAKNKAALAAAYGLDAAKLAGDYPGELDNGGERLTLIDTYNQVVDVVEYDDKFPWPHAADALGANENFLAPPALCATPADPLGCHRYKGHSLERIQLDVPGGVANWAPSALDGATPGRANGATATAPVAVVLALSHAGAAGPGMPIRATDAVTIEAQLSPGALTEAAIEYFVDNVEATGEPVLKLTAAAKPGAADTYTATIPRQADNAIVRYRVLGNRGDGKGQVVISPRPTDPYPFHAYFVRPNVAARTPQVDVFLSIAGWRRIEENAQQYYVGGRTLYENPSATVKKFLCTMNPRWNETVPGVLIYNEAGAAVDQVVDVRVRYQGSPYNRAGACCPGPYLRPVTSGQPCQNIQMFPPEQQVAPKEADGVTCRPMKGLSWHFDLPRYSPLPNGDTNLRLNKLVQACAGFTTTVAADMFEKAGIPATAARYVRFNTNGHYYRYMLQWERPSDVMVRRSLGKGHAIGDLFKVEAGRVPPGSPAGTAPDEGPLARGDFGAIVANPSCSQWTVSQRYAATYARKTNFWRGRGDPPTEGASDEVKQLIDAMAVARAADQTAGAVTPADNWPNLRKFFADNFDLELLLKYFAIHEWLGPWDYAGHNVFLYRYTDDAGAQKWMLLPYDYDLQFGVCVAGRSCNPWGAVAATASFFAGEDGNRSSRPTTDAMTSVTTYSWTYMHDNFFKAYRNEFKQKIKDLAAPGGPLDPAFVNARIDAALASYDVAEANAAASKPYIEYCNDAAFNAARMKQWTTARNNLVVANMFE